MLLAHGQWFSRGTQTSSTTKTCRHDIAKILLKVALSTKLWHTFTPPPPPPPPHLVFFFSYKNKHPKIFFSNFPIDFFFNSNHCTTIQSK
jgi:hypothetical protein